MSLISKIPAALVAAAVCSAGSPLNAADPPLHTSDDRSTQAQPVRAQEIIVSAAISLREALIEIGSQFEKLHPQFKVSFNFGASGELARQLELGAPADVFISASPDQIKRLQAERLINDKEVRSFAQNELVVVVPDDHNCVTDLNQLKALSSIAIGDPSLVPAGTYAKKAMTGAGVYAPLEHGHKLIYGESVRQVLKYVESGNVDAALVYRTDAAIGKRTRTCLTVPPALTGPILYPAGVLEQSKNHEAARAFLSFAVSRYSQGVLHKHGFTTPP